MGGWRTTRTVALRSLMWLLLGGWVACWVLFGAVVAPTAFRVLPSTELAGLVIGPVLGALQVYGGAAGILVGLGAWALGRGLVSILLALLMSSVCLVSHLWITPEIARIRDLAFGPEGNAEMAARFTSLHQLSVSLYVGVGIAALVLILLLAHGEANAAASEGSDPHP